MANVKNGRMFSAEFNKATEVNRQTRLLAQTPNEPVEYVDLEQVAEVVNEGMLSEQEAANTYATKTGEYKELTAGFAYEILGDGQATSEKFSFRPTGGPNRNVRDGSARIEVLKGNSVVWNQRVKIPNSSVSKTENNVTFVDNRDGSYTISTTAEGATTKTFFDLTLVGSLGVNNTWLLDGGKSSEISVNFGGAKSQGSGVIVRYGIYAGQVQIVVESGAIITTPITITPTLYNLTKMFGADNEPTTVEQFYEMLPEGVDINANNEGKIVDANYKAIKTTGFNQWNEQWELGSYNTENGKKIENTIYIRSANPIPVFPSTLYNWRSKLALEKPTDASLRCFIMFYDAEENFISYKSVFVGSFTTPANCRFVSFFMGAGYGTTYNNDICFNIAWDEYSALNGTYKPYKPFERDLSWVAKYFPATINGETKYGMRSAGNVADEIRFNSTTQQWEAAQNVGVRAYQSGDEADTAVTTDGKNTNYALATPIATPVTEDVNLSYDIADYGTEQLIVAEGAQSAPLSAEIVYENNASMLLKQIAPALDRLDAIEAILATMQASAVATINEE